MKKEFKLPEIFIAPDSYECLFKNELSGYRFYVSKLYKINKDKESECIPQNNPNLVPFALRGNFVD